MNREVQLAEELVGLAEPLAHTIDPVTLLDRPARHCVEIVGADTVGVMMATGRGELRTMTVTDDRDAVVELFLLQSEEGPCLDCYRENRSVAAADLGESTGRRPRLAPLATRCGYGAAHALPLHVRHQTIGALSLLLTTPGGLPDTELSLAQSLAEVAAVALVHRVPGRPRATDIHLRAQAAVDAKATIETATGMLAEHGGLTLAEARSVLHAHTALDGRRLLDIAQALVDRTLAPDAVLTTDR
jgi:hypothetical protein